MKTEARAAAPATIANLACGFDVLGLALEGPIDTVIARPSSEKGVQICVITGDRGLLPLDAQRNTAAIAASAILDRCKLELGVELELNKGLALASGLGSSTASAAAAAVAVDCAFQLHLKRSELLDAVLRAEEVACGARHADNAAPALLGGITLVRYDDQIDLIELPVPKELFIAVARPHIELLTRDSRGVLPSMISLSDAVTQWANLGGLVTALFREDWDLMRRSLRDVVAEPSRARLVPGFEAVKTAAVEAGALGASLAGSGPSVFAMTRGQAACGQVIEAMRNAFEEKGGVACDTFISAVATRGAHLLIE